MTSNNNDFLTYPREFRLLEELKNSDGYINYGTEDINLENFNVNLLLDKKFDSINFEMTISKDYPKKAPTFNFNDDIKNKILNKINWNEQMTLKDYLQQIYNLLNS
jgi:hypothetical protein